MLAKSSSIYAAEWQEMVDCLEPLACRLSARVCARFDQPTRPSDHDQQACLRVSSRISAPGQTERALTHRQPIRSHVDPKPPSRAQQLRRDRHASSDARCRTPNAEPGASDDKH